jgi:LPXTG-site transpeptidase (sortase) family protein
MAKNNDVDLSENIEGNDTTGDIGFPVEADDKGLSSLAATDQMRDFLNLDNKPKEQAQHDQASKETISHSGDLPPDLPFLEGLEEPIIDPVERLKPAQRTMPGGAGPSNQILGPATEKGGEAYAFFLWVAKNVLPYVVVFAIGVGLYFFYFSDFSISSLFKSNSLTIENVGKSNKDLDKLKKDEQSAYLTWMKQFFFEVNDDAIVSMDADVSGNGLSNFEKYLLNLNPKIYSSRGSNVSDGEMVLQNMNPLTGKPFTDQQKELVDKYINKELISNRITAAALSRGVTKYAQYVSPDSPYYIDPATLAQGANSQTGQTDNPELASNQAAAQAAQQSQSNNTAINVNAGVGVNQEVTGKLDIPANNISVPLIWTKDVKDFDADLKKGIVHYPGTVMPGDIGTSYISGHSSGYIWDHSPYKTIFAGLGQVKDGTSFTITITDKDGKKVIYHYIVDHRGEYEANDQAQFINTADSIVALSTCWPVGTTARRLVLFSKLTQTERS